MIIPIKKQIPETKLEMNQKMYKCAKNTLLNRDIFICSNKSFWWLVNFFNGVEMILIAIALCIV